MQVKVGDKYEYIGFLKEGYTNGQRYEVLPPIMPSFLVHMSTDKPGETYAWDVQSFRESFLAVETPS